MAEYVECERCGMVVKAAEREEPEPAAYEVCPRCKGTSFFRLGPQ